MLKKGHSCVKNTLQVTCPCFPVALLVVDDLFKFEANILGNDHNITESPKFLHKQAGDCEKIHSPPIIDHYLDGKKAASRLRRILCKVLVKEIPGKHG